MENRKIWLALLILSFLIGIFMRFYGVLNGSHQFAEDEIRVYNYAMEALNGNIPVMGPGGFGGQNSSYTPGGVVFYLLTSIPLMINNSPVSLALFFSILNIIGMFLVLILLKQFNLEGKKFYLSSILFNISPWPLFLSWGAMHYNIEAFFVIILMIITLKMIKDKKTGWPVIPLIVIIAFLPQFHLMIIYMIPFFILVAIVSRVKINIRYTIIAIILGISIYIPYFVNEIGNNFQNTKMMFTGGSFTPFDSLKILSSFIVISSGEMSYFFNNFNGFLNFLNYSFGFGYLGIAFELIFLALTVSSYIYFFKRSISDGVVKDLFKRRNFSIMHLLFLWIIIPTIFFIITFKGFMPRYMIIFYPLTQIIVIIFAMDLWEKIKNTGILKKIYRVGLILFFIIPLYLSIMMFTYYSKPTGQYDKRYWQIENIVEYIQEDCKSSTFWIEEKPYGWTNSQYRDYVSVRTGLIKDENTTDCYYKIKDLMDKIKDN